MRPYEASSQSLRHPELAETVFSHGARPDSVALAVEAARLAYLRAEASEVQMGRLADALGRVGFRDIITFNHRATDGQGFGAIRDGEVLLAFRGTQVDSMIDIATDLNATLRPWALPGGAVHTGFARTAQGLWDDHVSSWLQNLPKGRALTICGHSLGAAIATLLACMAHDLLQASTTHLVTIGSPRVGDLAFVAGLARTVRISRVVNCCDLVTEVPPSVPLVLPVAHAGDLPIYIDRHGAVGDFAAHASDRAAARAAYVLQHAAESGAVRMRDLADHAPANYIRAFYP